MGQERCKTCGGAGQLTFEKYDALITSRKAKQEAEDARRREEERKRQDEERKRKEKAEQAKRELEASQARERELAQKAAVEEAKQREQDSKRRRAAREEQRQRDCAILRFEDADLAHKRNGALFAIAAVLGATSFFLVLAAPKLGGWGFVVAIVFGWVGWMRNERLFREREAALQALRILDSSQGNTKKTPASEENHEPRDIVFGRPRNPDRQG